MPGHLGFIGVGNMGGPMAARLLDAGYTLTLFDARKEALQPFLERGAKAAATPAAVASAAHTVLVSLPTPDIVRHVALGPDGVIHGSQVKQFIDLSTTGPRMAQAIAKALAERGIVSIDAPVSGGVNGAKKGTLAVMVAGPKADFEALEPVLAIFGRVFNLGEKPGLGQTMKLANNLLSATAMAITSEAVVFGVKSGLDPNTMLDVINHGTGRNTASTDKFPRAIVPRKFDFGFATALMYKDVKLFAEEAEAMGVPVLVANAVRQLWQLTSTEIGPDSDFTEIVKTVERWAGVEVKVP